MLLWKSIGIEHIRQMLRFKSQGWAWSAPGTLICNETSYC